MPGESIILFFAIFYVLGILIGLAALRLRLNLGWAVLLGQNIPLVLLFIFAGMPSEEYGWFLYSVPPALGAIMLVYGAAKCSASKKVFTVCYLLWQVFLGSIFLGTYLNDMDGLGYGVGYYQTYQGTDSLATWNKIQAIYSEQIRDTLIYLIISITVLSLPYLLAHFGLRLPKQEIAASPES